MGYNRNVVQGEFPYSGAIFMSSIGTKKECFRRQLFALPLAKSNFVLRVKKGMTLFLFEFERRLLHGVFRATSNGEINMEPDAFRSTGRDFPAQVRFTCMLNCSPLAENEFQDAIRDNYFSAKKFNFGLSKDQVHRLIMLFQSKRIPKKHPSRSSWRYDENPAEGDERFDLRKKLVRNRLGLVTKEDNYDLGICEFEDDEVKEVDGHVYLNGKFEEKVNKFNCRRGQNNRTDMVDIAQKDDRDKFLTKYTIQSADFDDCDTGHTILEKHFDHSSGELQRVAEAGLHFRDAINDEYVHNNLGKIRGIKGKHDIEDRYRKIFMEPQGKHFGEIGVSSNDAKVMMDAIANANKDFLDDNRIQDEYHAIEGFRHSLSKHDLGSPRDRGIQTINDGWVFGHEPVESELRSFNEHSLTKLEGTSDIRIQHNYDEDCSLRSRTSTKQSMFKPRGTDFALIPEDDEKFGFTSVGAPYTHNSIRGISLPNNISFSDTIQNTSKFAGNPISEKSEQLQHPFESSDIGKVYDCRLPYSTSCDTTMIKMPIPYDSELPVIPLRPSSYFTDGPSSSPVDDHPFYPCSQDISTSLSRSKTLPYHSPNVGPKRYFDNPGYVLSRKSDNTMSFHEARDNHILKGNSAFKTSSREGSQARLISEFASPMTVETAENVIKGHSSHDFPSNMRLLAAYDNRYGEPRSKYAHKVCEPSHALKKFSSFDTDLHPCEEDPTLPNKLFCRPPENKHLVGTDKRVSVFARLTSASEACRHEQEHNSDEKHDLDASTNKAMKMLEKVVSSQIKATGKSTSAMKQDEDTTASKSIDFELSKVKVEPDTDITDEAKEAGSIVQEETRLMDFKRRKKANKNLDDKCKETFAGPVEFGTPAAAGNKATECLTGVDSNHLMGMTCKRRKLVRPVFVRNESTNAANITDMQLAAPEITPMKDEDNLAEAVKSSEKVEHVPAGCEERVNEGEECCEVEGKVENCVFVEGGDRSGERCAVYDAPAASDGSHKMCGWIEW